jgi:hypothetical protein
MNGFVSFPGIAHDVVDERNTAFLDAVCELESVEDLELFCGIELRLFAGGQSPDPNIVFDVWNLWRRIT